MTARSLEARCRAYDAVYGALALSREAVLLTLDEELRQLLSEAYPAGIGFSWED